MEVAFFWVGWCGVEDTEKARWQHGGKGMKTRRSVGLVMMDIRIKPYVENMRFNLPLYCM